MKSIVTGILMIFAATAFSQDITTNMSLALQSGDASAIAEQCLNTVDLAIPGNEDMYPKDQAQKLLATFFAANKPVKFEIKHEGTSKLNDQYRIGELTTAKGVFRVTFFIKNSNGELKIKQLRIEDAEDDF